MAVVSLREIAQRAGCSRSAVSYALRNSSNVSRPLRERVQKIAQELGWRPDPNLAAQMALTRQSLAPKDVPHLAIIIQKSTCELEREAAPRLQFTGAIKYVDRMGFTADVFNLGDEPLRVERLRGILRARGIQGIIFVQTLFPQLPESYLRIGTEFACVVVGTPDMRMPFLCVSNDIVRAGRVALATLLRKGYQRIGVIMPRGVDGPLGFAYTAGFSAGYAALEAGARVPILYVGEEESRVRSAAVPLIQDWLRAYRPDAVITTDPAALHRFRNRADLRQLPEWRFDLYSADLVPGQPVLGGVDLRQKFLGEAAVDVVVAHIHRGSFGVPLNPRSILVRPLWVDGSAYDPDQLTIPNEMEEQSTFS